LAIFTHGGQVCSSGSRTFVEEKIYNQFVEKSVKRAQSVKVGSPQDPKTQHGPQVLKDCLFKVQRNLNDFFLGKVLFYYNRAKTNTANICDVLRLSRTQKLDKSTDVACTVAHGIQLGRQASGHTGKQASCFYTRIYFRHAT